MFGVLLAVNLSLNFTQLAFYITCEHMNEDCNYGKFGFSDVKQAHFTITCFLLTLYVAIILAYVAILFKMRSLFKAAFPDNYKIIRMRFFLIFVAYEIFLGFRASIYFYILFSH